MYRVEGTTQVPFSRFNRKCETLEEAEELVKDLALTNGIKAKIFELTECCNYDYPYSNERNRVLQILDRNGVQYKVDRFLNIIIEF